jgi:hypothetical protein
MGINAQSSLGLRADVDHCLLLLKATHQGLWIVGTQHLHHPTTGQNRWCELELSGCTQRQSADQRWPW